MKAALKIIALLLAAGCTGVAFTEFLGVTSLLPVQADVMAAVLASVVMFALIADDYSRSGRILMPYHPIHHHSHNLMATLDARVRHFREHHHHHHGSAA